MIPFSTAHFKTQAFHVIEVELFLIQTIFISSIFGALNPFQEVPIREAFLRPRNFNPHPYQRSIPSSTINVDAYNFPPNNYAENLVYCVNEDGSSGNGVCNKGPIQFPQPSSANRQTDNHHPYAALNVHNDRLATARLNYVNGNQRTVLVAVPKKQYAFSYTVHDSQSGDDFSHTQQQKDGAVKGTYKVQLPDGRTQVVR